MSDIATREDVASLGQTVEAMTAAVNTQAAVMQDLARALGEQRHVESARATGGRAEMHFNAGPIGLWVAVAAAAVMLAVNLCLLVTGALWLGRIDRENSEHGHQLNAIYMLAPHLKPKQDPEQ
jgi:hypothetical protein